MMCYFEGPEIQIGDLVRYAETKAVVEAIIEGDEVVQWGLDAPGFMLVCDRFGRVLIEPSSYDWEDVTLIVRCGRGIGYGL